MGGWICLHRKLKKHWLYSGYAFDRAHAWIDILLNVQHSDGFVWKAGGYSYKLGPGQMFTSARRLADRWGWSDHKRAERYLKRLEADGMIRLEKKGKAGLVLTVLNWDKYQIDVMPHITSASNPHGYAPFSDQAEAKRPMAPHEMPHDVQASNQGAERLSAIGQKKNAPRNAPLNNNVYNKGAASDDAPPAGGDVEEVWDDAWFDQEDEL